jgi:mannan endo-1,4-beta-mannosidase
VEARLPIFSWFQALEEGWNFAVTDELAASAAVPDDCMIALEVWNQNFDAIIDGTFDRRFASYFTGAGSYPGRVIIRLFHESNGDWYPWSVAHGSSAVSDVEQWKQAWRRVVRIARQHAPGVDVMFCMNSNDVGGISAEEYWPGVEWVDIIGLDGCNWSWNHEGLPSQTAAQIIRPMYDRLTALHPSAEFMIGEMSSAEHPNKSSWFADLSTLRGFPRLTQVSLFHENSHEKKARDWRLHSDPETLAVSRAHLARAPKLR